MEPDAVDLNRRCRGRNRQRLIVDRQRRGQRNRQPCDRGGGCSGARPRTSSSSCGSCFTGAVEGKRRRQDEAARGGGGGRAGDASAPSAPFTNHVSLLRQLPAALVAIHPHHAVVAAV